MARRGVTEFLNVFQDVGTTFFDIESDLLVVLDGQGNIERVNPAFERMLGYSESDVLGMAIIRLVKMDDWAAFLRTFTSTNPAPVRLLCKGQGEIGVRLVACRFKTQRGYIALRPIGREWIK